MPRAEEKTVLVVDDEPNVRDYLAQILRDAGFNVLVAGDGEEALAIIRKQRPDFISLDLVMPRKTGHKLLYELRKDKDLARIPVVIVTAHGQDELGQNALQDIMENRVISGPGGVFGEAGQASGLRARAYSAALGIEETEDAADKISLQEELQQHLAKADPHALRRALSAEEKDLMNHCDPW